MNYNRRHPWRVTHSAPMNIGTAMHILRLTLTISLGLATAASALLVSAQDYAGKRILHIDSYHEGNYWNTTISEAVEDTLAGTGVELTITRMDTKRNPTEEFKQQAALDAKALIEKLQPDVVIASDDNASKYLIAPYFKDSDVPFVFCGVNWDASVYGFPFSNVTGMVEVSPVPQILELLRQHSNGDRVGYIAEDTPTKRKEMEYHERLFGVEYDKVYLVSNFEDWKASFLRAQSEVDQLVIMGVAAVEGWDDDAAAEFAAEHTSIPTGTDFSWLMHVAVFGVGKSPEEQGRWAAKAALRILDGVPPSKIPLAYNTEGQLYFNPEIAASIGVTDAPPLAKLVD